MWRLLYFAGYHSANGGGGGSDGTRRAQSLACYGSPFFTYEGNSSSKLAASTLVSFNDDVDVRAHSFGNVTSERSRRPSNQPPYGVATRNMLQANRPRDILIMTLRT